MFIRRDTRRRLDQFVANPRCAANVLSAVHDIPMDQVARSLGLDVEVGQSPFAIGRGITFERSLYADDAERLREALVHAGVLSASAAGFLDLRLRMSGGPMRDLDDSRAHFADALRAFAKAAADPAARAAIPSIVAAPALRIPGRAILPDGMFAVDVVTVHPAPPPGPITLRVGEIKVYPDRGGHTDPHELATTRAQAGVYVHALRLAVGDLSLDSAIEVAGDGFLVLTKPGSNFPSIRANEDLRFQAARAATAFERLREAAALAVPFDDEADRVPDLRLAAVRDAAKTYDEACVSFCELAQHCHANAVTSGNPAILGRDVARFLGTIDLPRALALMDGEAAASAAEADFVRRVAEARGAA